MQLDPAVQQSINTWLNGNYDADTKNEIKQLVDKEDANALSDAFYKNLEFGTGGLRGIMGAGSNRVNKYTIGTATQGFSNFLLKKYKGQKISVAISYDSRNNSPLLAGITADVFSANGIKVHFFNALRPTPLLSFAIRQLGCKGGVMLTASHNPKEYNGYKAYDENGCQLTEPDDRMVMAEVAKIESIDEVNFNRVSQNINPIGEEMDKSYLSKIKKLSLSPDAIARQHDLKIVYSPIHGTGITMVPPALKDFGFTNIHVVPEQSEPNGNFPTVVYPNPEEVEAMTLAMNLGKKIDADIVLATDPDADRVAAAVKDNDGNFFLLTGNQAASLLTDYLINGWARQHKLDGTQYVVKTIVTSNLVSDIAKSNDVDCYETLTGFKFIGALITELEGKQTFIGGGEESYGYSVGELVRDKDAVISCAIMAEMTAFYKDKGKTLFQALQDLYLKFGLYTEDLVSITKKGQSGAEEIKAMMEKFRTHPPLKLGGSEVKTIKDYALRKETDLKTGTKTDLALPVSDVLQFITQDGSIVSARPSGTEPKIKFYCSVVEPLPAVSDYEAVSARLSQKVKNLITDLEG